MLTALLPTVNSQSDRKIRNAIASETASLNRPNWVDDNHIDGRNGDKVFNLESDAADSLQAVHKPRTLAPAIATALQVVAAADRLLAQTGIDDLGPRANPHKVADAKKEMA